MIVVVAVYRREKFPELVLRRRFHFMTQFTQFLKYSLMLALGIGQATVKPVSAVLFIAALFVAGCRERQEHAVKAEAAPLGPEFSAKHGLMLPEQTRKSLGLRIVEVGEQKVSKTLELELRAYERSEAVTYATALVSPEQGKVLKAGQDVEVPKQSDETLAGKVAAVNANFEKISGQVEVLVEIASAAEALDVGEFVRGTVRLGSDQMVISIPRDALLGCTEGYFVYTVSGEHLVRTPVTVGTINSEWVEITEGLYAGDEVVLEPVMSLWLTELAAVKGGQACCIEPPKGK